MSNQLRKYYIESSDGFIFTVHAVTILEAVRKWGANLARVLRPIHEIDDQLLIHEGKWKRGRTLELSTAVKVFHPTIWQFVQLAVYEASDEETLQAFCDRMGRKQNLGEESLT